MTTKKGIATVVTLLRNYVKFLGFDKSLIAKIIEIRKK